MIVDFRSITKGNNKGETDENNERTTSEESIDQKKKKERLLSMDGEGRTCLHTACDSGDKEGVLKLLGQIQEAGTLEAELFRHDKAGRTPLCLVQAEKKGDWDDFEEVWENVESDNSYQARTDTAKAMLEWIRNNAPEKVKKDVLQHADNKGRTLLHRAVDSGDKAEVLKLLLQIQEAGALESELLRHDNTGRTPLCLAQAEKKQRWNKHKHGGWEGGWDVVESDESHLARTDTAEAMLKWIQKNSPDILNEVKIR